MSTAVQKAIAMAKAAEEALAAAQSETAEVQESAEIIQHPSANSVSAPLRPGNKLTMATMQGGALAVDNWLKVKEYGLTIGDSALLESMVASIEMIEGGRGFQPKLAIKAGNPAQYFYTLDGVIAAGGGSWENAVKRAQTIQSNAREYRCVDLPIRLEVDAVKGGKVEGKAGLLLGYTTSTTNWANWEKFYNVVAEAGLLGQRVKVKLTSQARSNKAGNKWGVLDFELLGALEEEGAE